MTILWLNVKAHLPGRETNHDTHEQASRTKHFTWPGPVQRPVRLRPSTTADQLQSTSATQLILKLNAKFSGDWFRQRRGNSHRR